MSELYQFVAANYFGTGEGATVTLLITRAYPLEEDYATESYFDENNEFHLGELKEEATPANRALREFTNLYGSYLAIGADVLSRDEFLKQYGSHCPEPVHNVLNGKVETPGNFKWHSQFHINYS